MELFLLLDICICLMFWVTTIFDILEVDKKLKAVGRKRSKDFSLASFITLLIFSLLPIINLMQTIYLRTDAAKKELYNLSYEKSTEIYDNDKY